MKKVYRLLFIFSILCIVLAIGINVLFYNLYGEFPEIFSEVMPENVKIDNINISSCGSFVDENNILWTTGIEYKNSYSLGLGHIKGKNKPIKVADNVVKASDSFYITTDNEMWAWNNIPYMMGMSSNEFEKVPVFVFDNVVEAFCTDNCVVIKMMDDSLILIGIDTFVSGNRYTVNEPLVLFKNTKSFCCIENYNANDSIYVIDKEGSLYVMGGNQNGQPELGEVFYEFTYLAENVQKVGGVSGQIYYLKDNGDLYAWGHYGDQNVPTLYLENISDFAGGNILFCADYENNIYKYRENKIIGKLANVEVKQISACNGIVAVLKTNGDVLLSGDENANLVIPTHKTYIDFENPITLQQSVRNDIKYIIIRYGLLIVGIILLVVYCLLRRCCIKKRI